MIEHYKRLVKLVLQNHSCNSEEESYNPQGIELEAVLLASHIRELENQQIALNQKESVSDANALTEYEKLVVSNSLQTARATEYGISKLTEDEMFGETASGAENRYLALDSAISKLRKNKTII